MAASIGGLGARVSLVGLEETLVNLNKEISEIQDGTLGGLLAAGLIVQGGAQKNVPVEHGNLKASAFTREAIGSTKEKPGVEVGFTASYALFVHENMEMKLAGKKRPSGLGVYWGPHGTPHFLTLSLNENHDSIINAIKSRVKK